MARNMKSIDFVNIRISKADKGEFETWAKDNIDDRETLVNHLCDAGYKISMSYDASNECYITAVTGKDGTPNNSGKCFTSRASDLTEAVMISLFKHWSLADGGDWDTIATDNSSWG